MLPRIYYDISEFEDVGIKDNGNITYARKRLKGRPKNLGISNKEIPLEVNNCNNYSESNNIEFLQNQITILQKKLNDCEKNKASMIEKIYQCFTNLGLNLNATISTTFLTKLSE